MADECDRVKPVILFLSSVFDLPCGIDIDGHSAETKMVALSGKNLKIGPIFDFKISIVTILAAQCH